ncbi:uncharacterized protein [Rutidosis leptorrhynchoides]|uniref:uncharacterized protein n=1 Tax=Rutidosis leptorrhynchoides TaxID=125765 RepID=UPI003A99E5F8
MNLKNAARRGSSDIRSKCSSSDHNSTQPVSASNSNRSKKSLWDSLGSLVESDEAWILCGDFNEVREESERFNCEFIQCRARWFNELITSSNLMDILICGRIFTRVNDDIIKFSKLDRFLASENVYLSWENLYSVALDRTKSDHCPIVLKDEDKNLMPKPFKVFDIWFEEKDVEKIIKDGWSSAIYEGNRMDLKFMSKLKAVKFCLRSQSKEKFGEIDKEIELHKSAALSFELKAETTKLNDSELDTWKNERKLWMDKDNIRGLNINGTWNENPSDIKNEAYVHFKSIFDEPNSMRSSMEDLVYPSITPDEAELLECPILKNEIREAVLDCGSTKAPGPDGFNMRFFKKLWDIIKDDLVESNTWFWENGELSRGCNASFVTLIPKKSDPEGLRDFRPISLIGSYYKIVAKVLSNRLRKVLASLVGSEQSAFLKGRFILDGALIANEKIDY